MDVEMRQVTRPGDFFQEAGRLYAIGELIGGRRWVRPATPDNPRPDLDSVRWPPTFVAESEIAYSFDADFRPMQADLFEAAA